MVIDDSLNHISSVLFVCMGNICRSPLAEGILRDMARAHHIDHIVVDSAGTGNWHVGGPPDRRSIAKAAQYGIDIGEQTARQIVIGDFEDFDLILAMDRSNLSNLQRLAPSSSHDRLHHFMTLALDRPEDVPDPYMGGAEGFETVYRMLNEGCDALCQRMR